jgi:tyrosyl-tRNA synthetase
MWKSRTKKDLMIEVWEKLDCESVGAKEIEAIETVVRDRFGFSAVESPMKIARLLADEGAELRHAEIMELDAQRRMESPYAPMFRNILKFADFKQALISIRNLENLRRKFAAEHDREGLRQVRETALKGKQRSQMIAGNEKVDEKKRAEKQEIAEWFTIWLQSPEVFENWIELRRNSKDFIERFGQKSENAEK